MNTTNKKDASGNEVNPFSFDPKDYGCFSTHNWYSAILQNGKHYCAFEGNTDKEVIDMAQDAVARLNNHDRLTRENAQLREALGRMVDLATSVDHWAINTSDHLLDARALLAQ